MEDSTRRYKKILEYFRKEMPDAHSELEYSNVFELLVAVMLSAQCTDRRVNMVTPALFARYPDAQALAKATADEVYAYIRSISYPNSKAQHLVAMAQTLTQRHGGQVPDDFAALTSLPGVGRKTANVIEAVAFGHAAMAVDTHVFRVSHRLGLVSEKEDTPYKVEQELIKHIPQEDIPHAHHWLLLHGRYVCTSKKPHCNECGLQELCHSVTLS